MMVSLSTAKWIGIYKVDDIKTYSDAIGFTRLSRAGIKTTSVVGINFNNKTINGYLYMGNANVNERKFYDTIDTVVKVDRIPILLHQQKQNIFRWLWRDMDMNKFIRDTKHDVRNPRRIL